ncbi:hypothetical protein T484DRAFT_1799462 [Baffinella frigidus]|nr:hypothetical protein T484DRAFT_1799462 [Cryptophyta sp. CCMP2293]
MVTGHSLGAGVAALLAFLLKPKHPTLQCVTFACPGGTADAALSEHARPSLLSINTLRRELAVFKSLLSIDTLRRELAAFNWPAKAKQDIQEETLRRLKVVTSGLKNKLPPPPPLPPLFASLPPLPPFASLPALPASLRETAVFLPPPPPNIKTAIDSRTAEVAERIAKRQADVAA